MTLGDRRRQRRWLAALTESDSCTEGPFLYANADEISVLLSGNDGQKQIYVCAQDLAGNVAGPVGSNTVQLDTVAPQNPSIALGGAGWITDATVTISLSAVDAAEMYLEGDLETDENTFSWIPYAASVADAELAAGDGLKIVQARFRDVAGNETSSVSAQVQLTPRHRPSIAFRAAAARRWRGVCTSTSAPCLDLIGSDQGGSGVSLVYLSHAGSETEAAIAYGNTLLYTLPDDGATAYDLRVWLEDQAGNLSDETVFELNMDDDPPVINAFTVSNESTTGYLTTTTADFEISVSPDVVAYRLSNDAVFSGAFSAPNQQASESVLAFSHGSWSLPSPTVDGSKTVYLQVADNAGNTASSAVSVVLDTEIPSGSVSIESGASHATTATVAYTLTYPADTVGFLVKNGASSSCGSLGDSVLVDVSGSPETVEGHVLDSGDGLQFLTVCFVDAAGNIGTASDSITVDTANPEVSVLIDAGAAYTQTAEVTLSLAANETVETVLVKNGSFDCNSASPSDNGTQAYAASLVHNLNEVEGLQQVTVCFWDAAGRVSSATDKISLDSVNPTAQLRIDDQAGFTNQRAVTLQLVKDSSVPNSFDDIVGMSIDANDCSTATYTPFVATVAHLLADADGDQDITVCLQDASGRTGSAGPTTIHLDREPPVPAVSINNGDAYTTNKFATVSFTYPSDTVAYAAFLGTKECSTATLDQDVDNSGTETITGFDLQGSSPGDGEKTVTVCLEDDSGLVSGGTDTITLDEQTPTVAVAIDQDAAYATETTVTLSLTTSETLDSVLVLDGSKSCTSPEPDFSGQGQAYASSLVHVLSSSDGKKGVTVCARDPAGNVTRAYDEITLDTTNPGAVLVVEDGASFTNDRTVTVQLKKAYGTESVGPRIRRHRGHERQCRRLQCRVLHHLRGHRGGAARRHGRRPRDFRLRSRRCRTGWPGGP